jgi:hypothetical protein
MEIKYVKQLKDENSISVFARNNGIDFSCEFVEFIKHNNGGRPIKNEVELENGSEKVVNNFLSFNEEDKENVYKARCRIEDKNLIPFANDPAGNYYCLKGDKVVFYSHEDEAVVNVAESFGDFLEKLR